MTRTSASHRPPNEWWVGLVAGMASYIDSAAIVANGIALVIYQSAIGITPGQIGVLSATLTLAIAFGSFAGGRAGDRYGRRTVFIVTMLSIVVGSALNTFAGSFAPLAAGVLLVGLGVGADLPVSLATIAEAAKSHNRGKILVLSSILWLTGIVASVAIAVLAGGWGRLGGQVLFCHVGVVALLVLMGRLGIPESASWLAARAERGSAERPRHAPQTSVADLLKGPHARPFAALLVFYTLTNLTANTAGQFNSYIAVNLAGSTVEAFNGMALMVLPLSALMSLLFMRVVDTSYRMAFFGVGAVLMIGATLVLAVFGFSMTTLAAFLVLGAVGSSFAFEGIMKVWTQESFPTMLRSTAQGAIIGVARIASALLALVTPALLLSHGRLFYAALAVLGAAGLAVAWRVFGNPESPDEPA